jgi:ABC-type branched-subunit amino acid transport system substrate-binding protein
MIRFIRSTRTRALSIGAILCVFVTVFAAGCGSNGTSGGIKGGPGVDLTNKTITLGILTPLTGIVAQPIGLPLTKGIETYFAAVNANGGIDGYKINLTEKDTAYDPNQEVQQYNAIKNQVAMFGESLGTPTTQAITGLANTDHILVSVASLDSYLAREPYFILIGTPYRLQVENAFDYLTNQLHVTNPKVGIIYQNDSYGKDGLQGYNEAKTCYNLNDVAQATYNLTDTVFSAQVAQMKQAGAKFVWLAAIPPISSYFIAAAAKIGYFPEWLFQSPAWTNLYLAPSVPKAFVGLLEQTVLVTAQGATWGDTSQPGMAQMLSDIQKYQPSQGPDGFFQFGYAESIVTAAILKKAIENKDLSRAGLYNAFNTVGSVDLGGLVSKTATYGTSPNQRVPSRDNSVFKIDPTVPNNFKNISGDFTGSCATQSQF